MTRGPLLLVLLQLALVASQVALKISSDNPPTFTDELKEPKFIVGFLPEGPAGQPHPLLLYHACRAGHRNLGRAAWVQH